MTLNNTGFLDLGLNDVILATLQTNNINEPTPIQAKAIPVAMDAKDVIGIAQTGTGKTLAYSLPILHKLLNNKLKGKYLIIVPTRELALQVDETFRMIAKGLGVRGVVLIGGASMFNQTRNLRNSPHIIIATPGRLLDHYQQKNLNFDGVDTVVLDEADRMLDIGFGPQIKRILEMCPRERQTLLFSATMPTEISNIAFKYMNKPTRVEVASAGTTVEKIQQEIFVLRKEDKVKLLDNLLEEHDGTVLVFSRTKHGASKIAYGLKRSGHSSAEIHSDRSLSQRRAALDGFKNGKFRILVATDIAARGIDVKGIELVINYDLPDNKDDYVHRIGRTGRAGREGKAISFATPEQQRDVRDIERLIRKKLPLKRFTPSAMKSL